MSDLPCLRKSPAAGFTLLELLVAMAIFAIVGALAMGGLNAVLTQREIAERQLARLHAVQRAVRVVANDFSQIAPRFVRDPLGTTEPPVLAPCGLENAVCFSRDGWRNPFGQFARGTLQRVQYRLEDGSLIREYWPVMDRTLANEARSETLVDNVRSFEITFLERSGNAEWQPQWPPLQRPEAGSELPLAIRISLDLNDWGQIIRLVELVQ